MNKRKLYGKLLLDLVMLVLLALMYRKNAISMQFHEWGGIALFGLFLIHKALNFQWIRSVTAGIFQRKAKLNARWIVDVLLLLSMTAVLVTGLLISKTLPTAIAGAHGLQVWHYFFAAVSLALSGIHLGLHATVLQNNLWKKLPLPETARKTIGILLLCVLFCFGSFHLVTSGFVSQFTRPFVSMTISRDHPAFEEMEHAPENGRGMGKGQGMGNSAGKGMGNGQGKAMNSSEHSRVSNAVSTFAAYASILFWFAVVTAALSHWFRKRRSHCSTEKE